MSFTDIFIRRPVLASVVNLMILALGLRAMSSLPVLQYPRTQNAVITVSTTYYGADPDVIAGFITTPLENAILTGCTAALITSPSPQCSRFLCSPASISSIPAPRASSPRRRTRASWSHRRRSRPTPRWSRRCCTRSRSIRSCAVSRRPNTSSRSTLRRPWSAAWCSSRGTRAPGRATRCSRWRSRNSTRLPARGSPPFSSRRCRAVRAFRSSS
jgi:AcrB/AcrD/AcrF family